MFLAYLMFDGPEPWYAPLSHALVPVDFILVCISLIWLLAAGLKRKNGETLRLPPAFWYLAGPAAGGAVFFLVLGAYVAFSS
jgi:TRAP-type C4-dicarboxylate transport system permease small subunit